MQNSLGGSEKKMEVSEEEAVNWIKNNNKDINPGQWLRAKYYEKIGIEFPTETEQEENLEKVDEFENDKYYINFFHSRTDSQIRTRYLNKLSIFNNGKEEEPRKKNQHIFIFDWDDTILCTSFLSSIQFLDIGNQARTSLTRLDQCAQKILEKAVQRGIVYIITNAAKGWVQYSSKLYLPKTHEILGRSDIKILSARFMFGIEYPGDFGRWKIQAFKSILLTIDKYLLTNLICIGDSNIEMQAAHTLSKEFQHCLVKTIKFRENPKPQELIKQQELVFQRMKEIFQSSKNLTIRLERKNSKEKK